MKYQKLSKVEIISIPFCYILEKINKNYDRKKLFWYHDALKIYGAPKLCTETALSNHPAVIFWVKYQKFPQICGGGLDISWKFDFLWIQWC